MLRAALLLLLLLLFAAAAAAVFTIDSAGEWSTEVPCFAPAAEGDDCRPSKCARKVVDGLFSESQVSRLVAIVDKALALRDAASAGKGGSGGPSIFDLNTGFIRDSHGLDNIFQTKHNDVFTAEDFDLYGDVIRTLKANVQEQLGPRQLYFTAPTFVTRLDGRNASWQPREIHDEYWHLHVDQNSTEHYHYSGLLYLSTYKQDFEGGLLRFFARDETTVEQVVEPRAGRALFFTSGPENPHSVDRVTQGVRYVLSFWFTCDPRKEFQVFLDGKAHIEFGRKFVASKLQQARRSEL